MRKLLILPLFVSLVLADFGAFAATQRRSARGLVSQEQSVEQKEAAAPKAQTARAARNVGVKNTSGIAPATARAATRPIAARAGTKQKVINAGTKVQSATTNTVVDQECQDAYFGCMDSFCMLDNTSGGRCQCSNKNAEFDSILEEIMKLDEQSYAMATEGVERLKMGENADEIMARAKAAADAVVNSKTAEAENGKTSRTLNLDLWNNDAMFEDDEEDIFDVASSVVLDKKGDALHASASKMCAAQIPEQCQESASMLQLIYKQKIKSDCTAYENSLKQQKNASAQKLQTAEKALRDAALEQFQDANKYNQGQCLTRYTQCMQTTAGCGADYSGCVQFSAEENIQTAADASNAKTSRKAKQSEKARTISGVVDIVLAGSTMNQLNAKKVYCDDDVLSHCVKYKDTIWDLFLRDAAPALKSAELNAEDDLRKNCISEVATCFKERCATSFDPNSDAKNYDMCLADPWLLRDSCKVKLDPCIVATGGQSTSDAGFKKSRLWQGVTAMLSALRVDACTKEVTQCIEGICGEDYAMCVGLSTDTIVDLCAEEKLTACQDRYGRGAGGQNQDVREYIAQVAQGYALKIDSKLAETCQKAAKTAMIKLCGDEETCEGLDLGNISFDGLLDVKLCLDGEDETDGNCYNSADAFKAADIIAGNVRPRLLNRINVNNVMYNKGKFEYSSTNNPANAGFAEADDSGVESIRDGLTNLLNTKIAILKSDATVSACLNGKKIQGISATRGGKNSYDIGADGDDIDSRGTRYPELLEQYTNILVSKTLGVMREQYIKAERAKDAEIEALYAKVAERLASIEGVVAEKKHELNKDYCEKLAIANNDIDGFSSTQGTGFFRTGCVGSARDSAHWFSTAAYDPATYTCTITRKKHVCDYMLTGCCWHWDEKGVEDGSRTVAMPKYNRERDLLGNSEKSLKDAAKTIGNSADFLIDVARSVSVH